MFNSLRARLWLTYAIIILLILSILGLGLLIYVIRNPIIDRQAIQRLDIALSFIQRQLNDRSLSLKQNQEYYNRVSESLTIRLLLFDQENKLLHDTESEEPSILWPVNDQKPPTQGRINDLDGKTWLYVSWLTPNGDTLMLAAPRRGGIQLLRSPQLRQILKDDFLPAFYRAGLVAFVLAMVFAAWLGSWITAPLKEIEAASEAVASGEFRQISIQGPDEVKTLAGSYNEMVNRVQTTQQSQRDFVANVSHELKTPLTSIQGFSQAILDGTVDSEKSLQKAAGIIKSESDRMYRLVIDLLDLARFDAGTIVLDRLALDLNKILSGVVDQLIPQAAEARVHLTLDVEPMPTCVGDEDRLAQVFTNLVDNAIKNTPAEEIVHINAWHEEMFARIQIRDSGEGIEEEHLTRIFERFYKIDKSRKKDGKPGTGLGLAIANQIAQAHGGEIFVKSTVGVGSVFEVVLPVVNPDDSTIAINREESDIL
ncbi:MAG: HAMP domain-containing histidine kinase [Anaerolineales bacterium]|nr:HAMP domain-containing histidine kinase [Anaerolineales bacterium]